MPTYLLIACCVFGCLPRYLGAAEPALSGASAEEAFIFHVVNAWRADPDRFDVATNSLIDQEVVSIPELRLEGQLRAWGAYIGKLTKLKSSQPPLVWSGELAAVAKASLERWKPSESGEPHNPAADFATAKVAKPPGAALALADGHGDLRHLFTTAMMHQIDKATHGPVAHAREYLMEAGTTSCGVALAKSGKQFKLAVIFSSQKLPRSVSGVAYRDLNRNRTLDQGEPLLAAELSLAGAPKVQMKAGMWTVAVGEAATQIACTVDGLTRTVAVPAGRSSAWLPIAAADKSDVAEINRLLALAAKVVPAPDEDTPDKTAFDIFIRMQRSQLDDPTAAAALKASAEVAPYVERGRKEFISVIGEERSVVNLRLDEIEKRWRKRGPTWIAFGRSYIQISKDYRAWSLLKPGDPRTAAARTLSKAIDRQLPTFTDGELWLQLLTWKADADACIYAAERGGGAKR